MFKIQTEQDEPRGGHLSIPALENARNQQPIKKKKEREVILGPGFVGLLSIVQVPHCMEPWEADQ